MTDILVSGYYGVGNAGDEAILAGLISSLRSHDPDLRIAVVSSRAAQTRQDHGVDAISRNDFSAIWRATARARLTISGGGSLLQDVTSQKSLLYYLGVCAAAEMHNRPVMFFAQGIGPLLRPTGRSLVRMVGNRVSAITVRDPDSAQLLAALGVRRPPVTVTADAALSLGPGDPEQGQRMLQAAGVPLDGRPLVGVSVRPWKMAADSFEDDLAAGLNQLGKVTGAHLVLFPMQQGPDVAASQAISPKLQTQHTVLTGAYSHHELRHMVAAMQMVIAMRYHALVFAALSGVPIVGISYDPKNDSFLRSLGLSACGTPTTLNAGALATAAGAALEQTPAERERLASAMIQLRQRSSQNARVALALLEGRAI